MVIVGLGLGLLAGFSISPVISGIITTLVGIAATVVAILGRFNESSDSREVFEETPPESSDTSLPIPEETEDKVEGKKARGGRATKKEGQEDPNSNPSLVRRLQVNPFPLVWLVVGITVGALGGMGARVAIADRYEQTRQTNVYSRQLENNQSLFDNTFAQQQQTFEQQLTQQEQAFQQQLEQRRALYSLEQEQQLALVTPPATAQQVIDSWVTLGISKEKIQERLFELTNATLPELPQAVSSSSTTPTSEATNAEPTVETPANPATQVGLYAIEVSQNDCERIRGLKDQILYSNIEFTGSESLKAIRDFLNKDDERELAILEKIVEETCKAPSSAQ